ncbi:uncharacterized protein LOC143293482 [Babylonia areolata]|uniref:uncharacterized protein LOC143293482 n=1 Tax=Babylonia areolata TaxID=304850 RepID=UPI003FD567C7
MTVVKMFILVAAIFAVCWAPYFAILLLEKIMGISDAEYVTEPGSMVRIFFAAFSTAYNFGLYVVYNRSFRQGLLRLLGVTDNVHCCGRNVRVQPCDDGMKSVTY